MIALFREALRRSIRPERLHGQSAPGWSFSQAFRSNGLEPKSDVYLASEAKDTLNVVNKDYRNVLKMVANMFSHLPAGWESQYMQELVRVGANVRNVFTAEIETIKCKLGINALDSGASIEDSDIEEGEHQDWDVSKIWRSLGGLSGSEAWYGRGGSCLGPSRVQITILRHQDSEVSMTPQQVGRGGYLRHLPAPLAHWIRIPRRNHPLVTDSNPRTTLVVGTPTRTANAPPTWIAHTLTSSG